MTALDLQFHGAGRLDAPLDGGAATGLDVQALGAHTHLGRSVSNGPAGSRRIGRLNVYRSAYASWYGPGLYGGHLGCGGTLDAGDLGVAHKSLPCGTRVTLRHHGRVVRVPVIDRGPYAGGREYDLTEATARRLKFKGHGSIQSTK